MKTTSKEKNQKLDSYKVRKIVFNNDERLKYGIPVLDSLNFSKGRLKKYDFIFERDTIIFNRINKISFDTKLGIILDYYYIGNDSVLRIQTRIKEGVYQKELQALLLYGQNKARFPDFQELEDICIKNKLFSKKDSLFYGYKLRNGRFEINFKKQLSNGLPSKKIDY